MPDHVVVRTPLGKLSNRNVPLTASLLTVILYLVGLLEGSYPTMFILGVLISWIYLRFYQRHSNGSRGDMADNFTFARYEERPLQHPVLSNAFCVSSFFPTVLQPPVEAFSSGMYNLLVRLKICNKAVRKYDVSAPTSITISIPGADNQDADRRRYLKRT